MFGPGDVRFFDAVAALYDRTMPAASTTDLQAGLAFAHRPLERVLDVGGGTGRAARALRPRGLEPTVVDFSGGMLARARAVGHPAIRADAGRLPVRDDAVDAVVVADALHHFPSPEAAVAECTRALGPGGVLVLREFDPTTRRGRALVALEHLAGMDSRFFAPAELIELLADEGLRSYLVQPGFGYTVVGVKPTDGDG
ncbi:class I SAM-dependent methyltransferase [Halorarum salinum]|uniref:Methyltransferase domain-containing protein n=1 Tax=Halorarum salinum TaxID=2743089 RepID=A0A7D5QGW0_9EURY|nr:methyltransferase domain-containing protein [Halobaculum salinum]QLG62523.1 methyltransferase domain-containing protein [Halobaculum salinum]